MWCGHSLIHVVLVILLMLWRVVQDKWMSKMAVYIFNVAKKCIMNSTSLFKSIFWERNSDNSDALLKGLTESQCATTYTGFKK